MTRDLLSLINDLLVEIFEYAVLDDIENGAFQSLKLSHISQQCRSLVLGRPNLWTNIRHGPELRSMDFVDACLERSGDLPLSIVVSVVSPDHEPLIVEPNTFMTRIAERAADRCKSMRFCYLPRPAPDPSARPRPLGMLYLDTDLWVGEGVFPELQTLDIRFPVLPTDFFLGTGRWSHRLWETPHPFPKLRSLSLRSFTLYQIYGYDDLTTLDIKCSDAGLTLFPEFLNSCHALQNLRFHLYLTGSITQGLSQPFTISSLRDFLFTLSVDGSLKVDNQLQFIFSQTVFTHLPAFDIRIEFLDEESWRQQWDEPVNDVVRSAPEQLDFGQYLKEIIRDGNFPSVETLRISLAARLETIPPYEYAKFTVPVQLLPLLRRLYLQSDLLLSPDVDQGESQEIAGHLGEDLRVELEARLLNEETWLERINGQSSGQPAF